MMLIYRFKLLAIGICLVAVMFLTGCGGGADGPPMAAVSGTVTLDGEPVEGATVSFIPKAKGPVSFAITGADGTFKMKTASGKSGAAVGEHSVTVSLTMLPENIAAGSSEDLATPQPFETEGGGENDTAGTAPLYLVPQKYNSADTSGLTATVPSGGTSDVKLELVSK